MGAAESKLKFREEVSFTINGEQFTVNSVSNSKISPNSVLVDFIRNEAELKGTKYMCREGGCGACVVMVKNKDAITGKSIVRAVNSCLLPVLSCDNYEIFTIESLGDKKIGYNEIQKRLTKFSGTQCAYCTPGQIMNMHSLMNSKANLTAKEIEDSFDGNICRCTGYRSILDAFKSMASDAPDELRRKCIDIEDCVSTSCQKLTTCETQNPNGTEDPCRSIYISFITGEEWIKPESLLSLFDAIQKLRAKGIQFRLVGGNTASAIYKNDGPYAEYIDINGIPEFKVITIDKSGVIMGSAISLSIAIETLRKASEMEGFEYAAAVSKHLERVANFPVRNVATIGGSVMLKKEHKDFPSDVFLLLDSIGAKVTIASTPHIRSENSLSEFLKMDMTGMVIVSFLLPPLPKSEGYHFRSVKIAKRFQNAHADVNGCFLFKLDPTNFTVLEKPSISYGGINPQFVHATETESYFVGKSLVDKKVLQGALEFLDKEIKPDNRPPDASSDYRKLLTQSILYKTILGILGSEVQPALQSGGNDIEHLLTSGKQTYDVDEKDWPLNKPIPKLESAIQCSGEAEYVNDIPQQPGELSAALVLTTVANADLLGIDATEASLVSGFVKILQAKDIPGPNNFMLFYKEPEEILVKDKVRAAGQIVCIVVATSRDSALLAAKKVKLQYGNIQKPILTIPDAITQAKNAGNTDQIFSSKVQVSRNVSTSEYLIKGQLRIGGQYHFHMETQVTLCIPNEEGMYIYSSTQWMDHIQATVASALKLPNNSISTQVRRLGGAYGAKISRATHVAVLCALASNNLNKPVRLVLDLEENMAAIGKRLPYYAPYEVGFNADGKIENLTCELICDTGIHANEMTSNFSKQCMQSGYNATGWNIASGYVNTNIVSNTFCRSPGSTQGIAVIETILTHIAAHLKKDPLEVRMNNLLKPGDKLIPVNSVMKKCVEFNFPEISFEEANSLPRMIDEIKISGQYNERIKFITDFNQKNRWKKRGMALVPIRYPLDYTAPNCPGYVAIYHADGTVAVSHGGIEVGQGINTKVAQVVAYSLKIPLENVKIKPSNNLVAPNSDSTGGSMTSEFACFAAMQSCEILKGRMAPVKEKMKGAPWEKLIEACYMQGIDLRAQYWPSGSDMLKGYNIWAVNLTEVEIDVLTGEYKILRLDLIEDAGKSLSQEIDIGQLEGALVMGLGLWTTEKLKYDQNTGELLTNNTWEYKVPLPKDIPEDFRVTLLQNAPNPLGILRSKAVGEPPLCTAVAVLFAIRNALDSARSDAGNMDYYQIDGPITPEDVLRLALTSKEQFII